MTSSSGDLKVLNRDSRIGSAVSFASSIGVEPCHGIPALAPAADCDSHSIGEVVLVIIHVVLVTTFTRC